MKHGRQGSLFGGMSRRRIFSAFFHRSAHWEDVWWHQRSQIGAVFDGKKASERISRPLE